MPRGHFVPAPGRVPVRERQVDQPARPGDAHHLIDQLARVGDVLKYIGGETEVGAAIADRQRAAICADRALRCRAEADHLGQVGLDEGAARATVSERGGEVAWPAADVEHNEPGETGVLLDL